MYPLVCSCILYTVSQVQTLVNHWLLQHAFSVGIGDTIAPQATLDRIVVTIEKAKAAVSDLIDKARSGRLERTPGRSFIESFEALVWEIYKIFRAIDLGFY